MGWEWGVERILSLLLYGFVKKRGAFINNLFYMFHKYFLSLGFR